MLSPGYSSDTAYVEFLNIEDAVHFMESNQVAHSCPSTAAVSSVKEGLGWGRAKGGMGQHMGRAHGNTQSAFILSISYHTHKSISSLKRKKCLSYNPLNG